MHFENKFPWCVLHVVILEALFCGVLSQATSSLHDMTSLPLDTTSVTHWTKCASTTDDNILRTIPLLPIKLCKRECGLRKLCVGVNYWSREKVCGLLSRIAGLESNVLYGKPCIHVAVHLTDVEQCDCFKHKVCEPESRTCEVQECPVPRVSNAMLRGNMYAVGSKVKVDCASGYLAKLPMICEDTGNWSNHVECGCPDPCSALSYATLQPGGAHVGDIRKYKCKPGYSTPEGAPHFSVMCLADRKWNTPTTYCGRAMDSDVGPTDYVTIGCHILKLSTNPTNHSEAKSACAPYGNLVRIDSAEKQTAINSYIQATASALSHGYWIQGHMNIDGKWNFEDGSSMMYTNWAAGNPRGDRLRPCIRLTNRYTWYDTTCRKIKYRALCELLDTQNKD